MVKQNYIKLTAILFTLSFSLLLIFFGPEVWGGVLALFILVICSWYISDLDIFHPLTWFPPMFFLYSTSMPILIKLGLYPDKDALRETIFYQWIALLTFIIFTGINKKNYQFNKNPSIFTNLEVITYPIYIISTMLCTVYMIYVYSNGMGKYAIALSNSPIKIFASFFPIYIITFLVLFVKKLLKNKKIPKQFLILNILYTFLVLLTIGERDIFVKVAIGVLLSIHVFHKKISKKSILAFGATILVLLPFMQKLKSGFIKDNITLVSDKPFIYELLGSEFLSASRNFNMLLINKDRWEFFMGKTFLWDIQVAFFNGDNSPLGWFNRTFYPGLIERGGGNGYSIVAEGYMNFGIIGIVLVFAFLAFLLRFLCFKAQNNVMWLIIYIVAIPTFIYIIRADLANLFAQVVKHIMLPLIIIFLVKIFLEEIFIKNNNEKKSVYGKLKM